MSSIFYQQKEMSRQNPKHPKQPENNSRHVRKIMCVNGMVRSLKQSEAAAMNCWILEHLGELPKFDPPNKYNRLTCCKSSTCEKLGCFGRLRWQFPSFLVSEWRRGDAVGICMQKIAKIITHTSDTFAISYIHTSVS